MKFPPVYTLTPVIQKLLYDLDVLKAAYNLNPVSGGREISLRRRSILKSSLFSARIEGNTLELSDINEAEAEGNREQTEVANLVRAYELLPQYASGGIGIETFRNLHLLVMEKLSGSAGLLRTEESAVYNMAGVAVYLTPAPQKIRALLDDLCGYINQTADLPPIIAGVSHIWFEKIHPFLDGNGRVGRLISFLILKKGGYDFGGLVPFEEYLENHRDEYYYFLGKDRQDVTDFLGFYLTALFSQAQDSLRATREPVAPDPYKHLLPRRAEIARIIADHKMVSFDFLSRRFRAVPTRTLHHDLSQLVKAGIVRKIGATRGVLYGLNSG